jgi:hypothetical protein
LGQVRRWEADIDVYRRWAMAGKSREGIPALKNDNVTGMTEKKQEKAIRESARAPRDEAAKELLEEQEEQASETSARQGPRDEA